LKVDAAIIPAFDARLAELQVGQGARIALAVSGGGDSMALAVLMQHWAARNGVALVALTVDHGLREGSAAEAAATGKTLEKLGVPHKILHWQGDKPASHIQERARDARYKLLIDAAKNAGVDTLMVAHNLEDQMETFWMRLAHGSGLDGLAGMAAARDVEGLRLLRPLLGFSRETLRNVCREAGVPWAEDPSNTNDKYLRVRLRAFEEVLGAEGFSPERLGATLQKLEDARQALQAVTDAALTAAAEIKDEGYATLDTLQFQAQPADIQRRMLSRLLHAVSPQEYVTGHDALEQLRLAILGGSFSGRTLSGCDVFAGGHGRIYMAREAAAISPKSRLEPGGVWDGRFRVSGVPPESFYIAPLNAAAIAHLRKNMPENSVAKKHLEALPDKIRRTLAGVYEGENLLAVPQLSWCAAGAPPDLARLTFHFMASGFGQAAGT